MTQACEHSHAHSSGLAGQGLARELDLARAQCAARREWLTASRERVLELMLAAAGPLKAYDLMAAFDPGGEQAKPPTVYRALDFLAAQGLAHRIESLNAYVACRRKGGHSAAFLICDCCGAAREFDPGDDAAIASEARKDGFFLTGLTLEAHGLCGDCHGAGAA